MFITTAPFSAEAREYVERIETRVVLIDGAMLARLIMTKAALGLHNQIKVPASSSGVPKRPAGVWSMMVWPRAVRPPSAKTVAPPDASFPLLE